MIVCVFVSLTSMYTIYCSCNGLIFLLCIIAIERNRNFIIGRRAKVFFLFFVTYIFSIIFLHLDM